MSFAETSFATSSPLLQSQFSRFEQRYLPLVGVLRCQWESMGAITTITYGTAILLSPRVVLTCTHNLYSEKKARKCDSAHFIPGANQGSLLDFQNYSIRGERSFKYPKITDTFRFKPLTEELSLILLEQPFQNTKNTIYPKIGTTELSVGSQLKIAAYPSLHYYSKVRMADVRPQRKILTGSLYSLKEHVINHTLPTQIGMSGAPIFAKNQANQDFICGIHTHRGQEGGYNSGLYFNSEVVNKLRELFDELKTENGLEDTLNLLEMQDGADMNESELCDESFENMSQIDCFEDLLDEIDNRNSSQGIWTEMAQQS